MCGWFNVSWNITPQMTAENNCMQSNKFRIQPDSNSTFTIEIWITVINTKAVKYKHRFVFLQNARVSKSNDFTYSSFNYQLKYILMLLTILTTFIKIYWINIVLYVFGILFIFSCKCHIMKMHCLIILILSSNLIQKYAKYKLLLSKLCYSIYLKYG